MRKNESTGKADGGFKWLAAALSFAVLCVQPLAAEEATEKTAAEKVPADLAGKIRAIFPGITINSEERFVDVQSVVCLAKGYLEVIACTKDSREHESIVMVEAKPSHIHASLLLIGATPGSPAMRKPSDEEGTRWLDIPPSGQAVKVTLLVTDEKGVMTERPISDFLSPSDDESSLSDADKAEEKFPDSFLFAGSHTHQEGETKTYIADVNGNVISISTFGDEVLCLSGNHVQENHALAWQINTDHIPDLGTKVTLRLRPQVAPEKKE